MTDENEFRAPFAHVPSGLVGVGAGLVMGALIVGLSMFAGTSLRQALVIGVVFGVLLGIAFTVLAMWTKRRSASPSITLGQRVNKALQKGHLPDNVHSAEWLSKLDRSRKFWKVLTTAGLVLYPGLLALGFVVLASGRGGWRMWAEVVFFAVMTVFSTWQGLFQLRRIRVLTDQLNAAPQENA
ncbi:hypothetical protein GCM10025867_19540 [Frondihabitans sucicola]|uniref:Uncharacterized protein n=1 Tax=Frondihabitans sucicola TaxID=1268041 RepID=A0ABN6Y134_9MICO|nr:hypothetical protein [Frondihabitans sucicola]BDZ49713.1 hypothetical protein GCM10025867_19540 [Frondihabitans sucicola]